MVEFSITCSGSLQQTNRVNPTGLMHSAVAIAALALAGCSQETDPEPRELPVIAGKIELMSLDPIEAEQLSKSGKIRLIDVRSDAEIAEGIIPGAEHIELSSLDPAKLDLSDGREPVFYCRTDRRSELAAEKFTRVTGRKAGHLKGGIKAWEEAELPIQKPPALF